MPTPEPPPKEEQSLPDEAVQPAADNAAAETEETEEHEPDPYDELWDPDMDTRPERIRKTRARREFRPKGGTSGRGRKREGL